MKDLTVITGCDSGIGKASAEIILGRGGDVAISYLETNPFKNAPLCSAYKADMTNAGDIEKFVKSIK